MFPFRLPAIAGLTLALTLPACTDAVDDSATTYDRTDLSAASGPPAASREGHQVLEDGVRGLPAAWLRSSGKHPITQVRTPEGTLRTVGGLWSPMPEKTAAGILDRFLDEAGASILRDPHSTLELDADVRRRPFLPQHHLQVESRHLHFNQLWNGVPVRGGELRLHLREGHLTGFTSTLKPLEQVLPANPEEVLQALEAARRPPLELGLSLDPTEAHAEIFVTAPGIGEYAWRMIGVPFDASNGEGPVELSLSAVDGRILRRVDLVLHADGTEDPISPTEESGDVSPCVSDEQLECALEATGIGDEGSDYNMELYRGSGFPLPRLIDAYKHPMEGEDYPDLYGAGGPDDTYFVDLSQASSIGGIYVIRGKGYIGDPYATFFFDDDDYIPSGPGATFDDQREYGDAVNAVARVRETLEYYRDVHNRRGLNDDPERPLDVVARVNLLGLNAAWVSDFNYIFFGSWLGNSLAIALDVAGHELTHGVIGQTARLDPTYESGALNEALADIFGVLVQAHEEQAINWKIGEDIPGLPPLRDLENPETYGMPGHMSEYDQTDSDEGGVHDNSGIPAKAFQLAVQGTAPGESYYGYSVQGADDDLLQSGYLIGAVFYQVLDQWLTSTATFSDWAISSLAAVDEIGLGPDEADRTYLALRDAFLATGILTTEDNLPLTVLTGQILDDDTGMPLEAVDLSLSWDNNLFETASDANGVFHFVLDATTVSGVTISADTGGYFATSREISLNVLEQADLDQIEANLFLVPRPPPRLNISSTQQRLLIQAGSQASFDLILANDGDSDSQLRYALSPKTDYSWEERPYDWLDISRFVDPINLVGDQEHSDAIFLETPFPFFFEDRDRLYISTDGYFTFEQDSALYYEELSLPNLEAPRALIAPYWADLDFGFVEHAYVWNDIEQARTYVQFDDVPDYLREHRYTFQTILHQDGRIQFNFMEADVAPESWARVGLQDGTGREGLEVAVQTPDDAIGLPRSLSSIELLPSIPPHADRVILNVTEGLLDGGTSQTIPVTINAHDLDPGDYSLRLRLDSNSPEDPLIQIAVNVVVE